MLHIYWFLAYFFQKAPPFPFFCLTWSRMHPSVLVLTQNSPFPPDFCTDLFGTIFFQEASNFDLYSCNTDTASGLQSLKDLCCEHTFLLQDKPMEWEITPLSTSEDTHETPPKCLTLSVSCHLVFQNWSCQVLDESKSKSTRTASRHTETKDSKKIGFETRSRESEANTVGFTKKSTDFPFTCKCGKEQCNRKADNFFSKLLLLLSFPAL